MRVEPILASIDEHIESALARVEGWFQRADEYLERNPWRLRLLNLLVLAVAVVVSLLRGHRAADIVSDFLFLGLLLAAAKAIRWLGSRRRSRSHP